MQEDGYGKKRQRKRRKKKQVIESPGEEELTDKEFYKQFKIDHLNKPSNNVSQPYNRSKTTTKIHWRFVVISLLVTLFMAIIFFDLPYQVFFIVVPMTITTTFYTRN